MRRRTGLGCGGAALRRPRENKSAARKPTVVNFRK